MLQTFTLTHVVGYGASMFLNIQIKICVYFATLETYTGACL